MVRGGGSPAGHAAKHDRQVVHKARCGELVAVSSPLFAFSTATGVTVTPTSSTCGSTTTVAVDVCTRPMVSVAGTRCTRCTPASHLREGTTRTTQPHHSLSYWWDFEVHSAPLHDAGAR